MTARIEFDDLVLVDVTVAIGAATDPQEQTIPLGAGRQC